MSMINPDRRASAPYPSTRRLSEIPHAQAILGTMQIKDTLVTADALHAQKQTVALIHRQGGGFLIGLKGNQNFKA